MSLGKIFLTEALKVARVGVGAYAQTQQQAQQGGGKRRRRMKKADDCTPCAAFDMADSVQERVREGRLL